MNWPGAGNDPFYLNNPTENTARRSYYGINAVFNMKCDGVLGNSGSSYLSYYNQRTSIPSPVALDASVSVGAMIDISVDVTAEATYSGTNLKLRAALIELQYDIPGTGWTYTHCERAMVDMAPDPTGINFNISAGQTVTLNTSFPMPAYPPSGLDNFAIVIFVQNDNTREVLQAKHVPIPLNFPSLSMTDYDVDDPPPGGNGNGLPEPGETCEITVQLTNGEIFAMAHDVTGTLSTDDPLITITDPTASFGDINSGASVWNDTDPFIFDVDPSFLPQYVEFQLDIVAEGGSYTSTEYFEFIVGVPTILLVDDDGGMDYETDFMQSLDEIGQIYDVWHNQTQGTPTGEHLANYGVVIWFTGTQTNPIVAAEQTSLAYYMDNGGKLFMSSENLGDAIGTSAWYQDYMHAQHVSNSYTTVLYGIAGDPISDGTSIALAGGAYWSDSQSIINPDPDAFSIYEYSGGTSCGALRYEGTYKLVYTAFSFECVHPNSTNFTFRSIILQNILDWLSGGTVSEVTVTLTPYGTPIQIPAGGGSFNFNIAVANTSTSPQTFDIWSMATLPNGNEYGPILDIPDFTAPAGFNGDRDRTQVVPASAPAGAYTYDAYVGVYPDEIWDEDHFDFTKSAADGGGQYVSDWDNWGESFDELDKLTSVNPVDFVFISVSPNPFNPQTTISLSLPVSGEVKISVFNLLGEVVAKIHDGWMDSGSHQFNFDGANLASGMYLLQVESPQSISTQKMILMK